LPGSFSSNRTSRQSRETKEFKAGIADKACYPVAGLRSRRTALNAPDGVSGFRPQLRDKREVIRLSVVDQQTDREFPYIAAPTSVVPEDCDRLSSDADRRPVRQRCVCKGMLHGRQWPSGQLIMNLILSPLHP
jgi:hypothetical protein